MRIPDWPETERPREKLLMKGASTLSDAELLAIFLRTGIKGKTAVDLARELLIEYGSLRGLLDADLLRFKRSKGLGDAKYAQLQAVLEMAKRHFREPLERGKTLASAQKTRDFLKSELRDNPHEVFACLFLDSQHQVIKFDELFHGTINGTSIYPREVVKKALGLNAAAVIFAHNHPSGVVNPSDADKLVTDKLQRALALIDVRVLDHFIIGDDEPFSFAENGLL